MSKNRTQEFFCSKNQRKRTNSIRAVKFQSQDLFFIKYRKKNKMASGSPLTVGMFYTITLEIEAFLKKEKLWTGGQVRAHLGRAVLRYEGSKIPPGTSRKKAFLSEKKKKKKEKKKKM